MDYFTDVFATFLSPDRGSILAGYGRVRELLRIHQKYLFCVPKMNEGLMSLEWHEGE